MHAPNPFFSFPLPLSSPIFPRFYNYLSLTTSNIISITLQKIINQYDFKVYTSLYWFTVVFSKIFYHHFLCIIPHYNHSLQLLKFCLKILNCCFRLVMLLYFSLIKMTLSIFLASKRLMSFLCQGGTLRGISIVHILALFFLFFTHFCWFLIVAQFHIVSFYTVAM